MILTNSIEWLFYFNSFVFKQSKWIWYKMLLFSRVWAGELSIVEQSIAMLLQIMHLQRTTTNRKLKFRSNVECNQTERDKHQLFQRLWEMTISNPIAHWICENKRTNSNEQHLILKRAMITPSLSGYTKFLVVDRWSSRFALSTFKLMTFEVLRITNFHRILTLPETVTGEAIVFDFAHILVVNLPFT